MAPSEYTTMEPSELDDKLIESRKELFNLRFQKATGQLDNTARLGHVRKDIARILTVLRQQELGIDEEPVLLPAAGTVAGSTSSRRAARQAEADEAETDDGADGADEDDEDEAVDEGIVDEGEEEA